MVKHYFFFTLLCISLGASAQLSPIVDSIPMSDGRKLAADVYIPSGVTTAPVILIQTPYNRKNFRTGGLPLGIGLAINTSPYIFVVVDWRGFYGSAAAQYAGAPPGGKDGYSCVEWIATQTWSNGKVGTWGPSALGRIQYATAEYNPPHLTAMCPLVAGPQYTFYEYYPNGPMRTEYLEQETTLGFSTIKPLVMAHQTYDNTWQYIEGQNFYPDSIRVPCFMIGGWYDHDIKDMLAFFAALQTQSPANVQAQHRLMMGPWTHGGHGSARPGSAQQGQLVYNNATTECDSSARAFFDYQMRQIANGWDQSPAVQYYQMGDDTWNGSPSWPPTGTVNTNFYLHKNGLLDNVVPTAVSDSVNLPYDPTNPSPTYGGPTLRSDLAQGPYDQSDTVEGRGDVAIFTTDTLRSNVVMKGGAIVHLKVSSNRFDTDFNIRLTDVYPDGRSMLVDDGAYRMRFANGFTAADTSAITPGQVYDIAITPFATSITFLAGHRIRVDVTGSNYPRFNRNMNTDGAPYPNNSPDTLINPLIATNTVYTNSIHASYLELPLVGYTAPNGIKPLVSENTVEVFPNPASGRLYVRFTQSTDGQLLLYDISGNIVTEQKISGTDNMMPIQNLATGMYLLKIQTNTGTMVKKVVVN